jgi:chromosome segregation ATPase
MSTVATLYENPNFSGTQNIFDTNDLNSLKSVTSYAITDINPVSLVIEPGYFVEFLDENNAVAQSYPAGSYNSITNTGFVWTSFRFVTSLTPVVPSVLPSWKRSKLNLYDLVTDSLHLEINQATSSTQFDFPTNLTFADADNTRNISDVLDYLERVVSVESDIDALEGRASVNEADIDLLEGRASVNEADVDSLETRASVNEADLVALDSRSDSNASRLLVDDSEFSALEAYVDALEGRASVNEADINLLEARASVNEADLVVLDSRSDSNASRLLVDDSELSALEAYVDALEGRASVNEADIDSLESRASVNEADIDALESRADSNAARLSVDDSELSALEAYVDALETRMSTAEVDIVDLENSFTVYEADVVDIKGTLYAISDGNIESMLSSLQGIKESFESNANMAEDMVELNARLTELVSVVQELTESVAYPA